MSTLPSAPPTNPVRRRQASSRLPLVLIVAGSLVAASVLRSTVIVPKFGPVRSGGSVGQFNSYTLGLLLGGLRGPLVMTLWSTSETQKGERNLEDINTKIELIGMLQPEFDAVHLFQIWNKAYNLSVQMSNLPSKYATILDALSYADNRVKETGPNINIESQIASIWFDKLGNSQEKAYYRARIREESRKPMSQTKFVFPANRRDEFVKAALAAGADGRRYTIRPESGAPNQLSARLSEEYATDVLKTFTGSDVVTTTYAARDPSQAVRTSIRNAIDPVLDADGRLLDSPDVVNRSEPRPADATDAQWRPQDGRLAYLERFEPFPYGVSPYGYGYNYYKRSLALQVDKKQSHAQLSERVISSRPALSLKSWAEEEIELGRRAELAQFGLSPQPEEETDLPLEMPGTVIGIDRIPSTPLLREAIYNYGRAADLESRAIAEFKDHVSRYSSDAAEYRDDIADMLMRGALARADGLYLQAITAASDEERAALAKQAAASYRTATELVNLNILAFYIQDSVIAHVFPQGYGKLDAINAFENPAAFPVDQAEQILRRAIELMTRTNEPIGPEVAEYGTYAARAQVRLAKLAPLLGGK